MVFVAVLGLADAGCLGKKHHELGGDMKCGVGFEPQGRTFANKEIAARRPFRCVFTGIHCTRPEVVIRLARVVGDLEEQVASHNEDWSSDLGSLITNESVEKSGAYRIRLICGAEPLACADFSVRCAKQPENAHDWMEIAQTDPKCLDLSYVCSRFREAEFIDGRALVKGDLRAMSQGSRLFKAVRRLSGCPEQDAQAVAAPTKAQRVTGRPRATPNRASGYGDPFDN